MQVTIGADGRPLPRNSRALRVEDGAALSPSSKRKSDLSDGGPSKDFEEGGKNGARRRCILRNIKANKEELVASLEKRILGARIQVLV